MLQKETISFCRTVFEKKKQRKKEKEGYKDEIDRPIDAFIQLYVSWVSVRLPSCIRMEAEEIREVAKHPYGSPTGTSHTLPYTHACMHIHACM